MSVDCLISLLNTVEQEEYPTHSRVHKLRVGDPYEVACYIKREDELGCVLSGSKIRKYT